MKYIGNLRNEQADSVCLVLGIIPREKIFDHTVDPRMVLLDYTKGVDSLSQLRDIEKAIEHPTR